MAVTGVVVVETDQEFMSRIDRDSLRRALVLLAAVLRAGQDGGVEGDFDVYGTAEQYNSWVITGKTDFKNEPVLEKTKEEEDQ